MTCVTFLEKLDTTVAPNLSSSLAILLERLSDPVLTSTKAITPILKKKEEVSSTHD